MRDPVGVLPRRLDARLLERPLRTGGGGLAQPSGRQAREPAELFRQPLGDLALDVHVCVQLGDQEVGDGVPDLLVLEQLAAGPRPRLGLERLALDPQREHGEEPDYGREHDERDRDPAPLRARVGGDPAHRPRRYRAAGTTTSAI